MAFRGRLLSRRLWYGTVQKRFRALRLNFAVMMFILASSVAAYAGGDPVKGASVFHHARCATR
jgi:hypothetical protein